VWHYNEDNGIGRPALFMNDDLYKPINPVYVPYSKELSALYPFLTNLHLHLFHSVLAPEDFALYYGDDQFNAKVPIDSEVVLKPDLE